MVFLYIHVVGASTCTGHVHGCEQGSSRAQMAARNCRVSQPSVVIGTYVGLRCKQLVVSYCGQQLQCAHEMSRQTACAGTVSQATPGNKVDANMLHTAPPAGMLAWPGSGALVLKTVAMFSSLALCQGS